MELLLNIGSKNERLSGMQRELAKNEPNIEDKRALEQDDAARTESSVRAGSDLVESHVLNNQAIARRGELLNRLLFPLSGRGRSLDTLDALLDFIGQHPYDKDTTGGLLVDQGYGDFNKDGRIDVRDAVGARKKLNRTPQEVNRDELRKMGINVNLRGQLEEGE